MIRALTSAAAPLALATPASTAGGTGLPPVPAWVLATGVLLVALLPVLAVLANVIVLVWHGIRGTDPGPAGQHLITLADLTLHRPTRGRRHHPNHARQRNHRGSDPDLAAPAAKQITEELAINH
jgi:hypothetical protein